MSEDRKRRIWPWVLALLIGLPVVYVASFGPACWLLPVNSGTCRAVSHIYRPMIVSMIYGPHWIGRGLWLYSDAFGDGEMLVQLSESELSQTGPLELIAK